MIRQFGILNEQVTRNDALLYGIPYPGVYVTNETGTVVAKFFHDSYKKRESPEFYIDAALGRLSLDEKAPQVSGGDQDINLTIAVHGGNGTVRQGIATVMAKLTTRTLERMIDGHTIIKNKTLAPPLALLWRNFL